MNNISFLPLIGVAFVAIGFLCRFNPMIVVSIAAVVTGLAAKLPMHEILVQMGNAFVRARNLPLITLMPLPIIGLLERHGLKEFVQHAISRVRAATAGRSLIIYMFVRQLSSAIGLVSLGGHAQMIRPLIAPMAEGVARSRYGKLTDAETYRIRAFSASADNLGLFFGEDIFVAFGAVLFMQNFLHTAGLEVNPTRIAFAGIPVAIFAFFVHSYRLYQLDVGLNRGVRSDATTEISASSPEESRT